MAHLYIPPLSLYDKARDAAMVVPMYIVLGAWTHGSWTERPQQTHPWNNIKFPKEKLRCFDREKFVHCDGISGACKMFALGVPMFHLPLFGGWKHYVVISPTQPEEGWHIGWTCDAVTGASRIRLTTPARVLIGPGPIDFFGVSAKRGKQKHVKEIGRDIVGRGGEFSKLPFL